MTVRSELITHYVVNAGKNSNGWSRYAEHEIRSYFAAIDRELDEVRERIQKLEETK